MSAEAIARLGGLWEKLTFAQVSRVIARQPEDVLDIKVRKVDERQPKGFDPYVVEEYLEVKRWEEVPPELRWRTTISWRHFYGFTKEDIYFQSDKNAGLDLDIDCTLGFSHWGNHKDPFTLPSVEAMLCGEVEETPKGKRFKNWFVCSPEVKHLIEVVRHGTSETEVELAHSLQTSGYPDSLWAITRLALFDNVQAFVDQFKTPRPEHPCKGHLHGIVQQSKGMQLSMPSDTLVHLLAQTLGQRDWWDQFRILAEEQGIVIRHNWNYDCVACRREREVGVDWLDFYITRQTP